MSFADMALLAILIASAPLWGSLLLAAVVVATHFVVLCVSDAWRYLTKSKP